MRQGLIVFVALFAAASAPPVDPFAFFQPAVAVTASDRARLGRGEPVARVLPADDGDVAVWVAVPATIDGDRLVAWVRRIEALKKSSYVLAIARFSDPPRLDDLRALTLDEDDVSEIQGCRPGHCGLKLSASEMAALKAAAPDRVQQRFRELVLDRVRLYIASGDAPSYEDGAEPVSPTHVFSAILDRSTFLAARVPAFAESLRTAAVRRPPGGDTFLYWSKERVADKPIVSVTEVHILRSQNPALPEALVAGRQIFSSHYISGSLGLTALMRGAPGGPHYLVYVNRTNVDVLRGTFGGIIRWFAERRLKSDATNVLGALRRRLESGNPE